MKCPRHGTELRTATVGPKTILRCAECHGVFVRGKTVDELHAFARLSVHKHELDRLDGRPTPTTLKCPEDGEAMLEAKYKSTQIDICRGCHGIWLDGDEVDLIAGKAAQVRKKVREVEDTGETAADVLDFVGDAVSAIGDVLGSLDF